MTVLGELTKPKVDQLGPPAAGEFVYVDISSIDNKLKRIVEPKRLSVGAAPSRARQWLKAGDVLVSMTRPNLNAVAIVPPDLDGAIGSTGFHVLRANEKVLPNWLYYGVQSRNFIQAMSGVVQGALYPAVRPRDIQSFDLPAPAVDEQLRIVAEIEKQFSRLDEAVANLQRVKANLKRYKAAVLKAAMEGRLVATEAELSRVEGHQFESGEELIARIVQSAGVSRRGDQSKVGPPVKSDEDCAEVPEGWALARSGDLFSFVTSGSRGWAKYYADTGSVFIRVGNLDHDTIDLDLNDTQLVLVPPGLEAERSRARPGDLVISITAELGMVAVIPRAFEDAYVNQHVAIARPVPLVDSSYLGWYFACKDAGKGQLEALRRGATKAGLGLDDIRAVVVALPPLAEQNRIVAEVDRRLSIAREVEAEVDANLKRAQALRQAVLREAFFYAPAGKAA